MLSITPKALSYIKERNTSIYLELPPMIDCCIHLQEAPMVILGVPSKLNQHDQKEIEGIMVYLPADFPEIDLRIELTSFLGFKKLVIEGWHLA